MSTLDEIKKNQKERHSCSKLQVAWIEMYKVEAMKFLMERLEIMEQRLQKYRKATP